jgi:hypothetical protein
MRRGVPDERPPRADLWRSALLAVAVALGVAALAAVDGRRADAELDDLRNDVCAASIPPRLLARADGLFDPVRRSGLDAPLFLRELDAAFVEPVAIALYFETESALWRVPSWGGGAEPTGGESWPWRLARWEELAWQEGCRARRDGSQLTVVRTLATPGGKFVVLVANRRRPTS